MSSNPVDDLQGARKARTLAEVDIARRKHVAVVQSSRYLTELAQLIDPSDGRPAMGGGELQVIKTCAPDWPVIHRIGVRRFLPTDVRNANPPHAVLAMIETRHDLTDPAVCRLYHDDQIVSLDQARELLAVVLIHWEDFSPDPDTEIPL